MEVAERDDLRFADKTAGENAGVRSRRQREAAIKNRQPDVIDGDGKVEQPRGPEFPVCPATQRGGDATADVSLREFAAKTNCDHQCDDQQQDRPAAGVPSHEPVQQVGSECFREQENADCPQPDRSSRQEKKSSEREAQESRREIRRKSGAGNEAAAQEQPSAPLGEPFFAPRDGDGVEESFRPGALQQRPPDAAREQIEQRVAHPDAEEHAEKTGLPAQGARRSQQRGAHGRHVFLHEREQTKCCCLCHGQPVVETEREPEEGG